MSFGQDSNNHDGSAWSPDGRWLASPIFNSKSIELFSFTGQVVNRVQTKCDLLGLIQDFAWLPDGRMSCFVSDGSTFSFLALIGLDQQGHIKQTTQITIPLTPATSVHALQWSPHHFWLAVLADKVAGEDSPTLYLTDVYGHLLMSPLPMNANQLAWSPDGTMLAVTEPTGDVVLFTVHQTASGTLAVKLLRRLVAGASDIGNVIWSPSGHWLLCRHASYKSEDYLFLLAADGSGKQVKLTSSISDGQLDFPAWSPNGKQLIVAQIAPAGNTLVSLDIATLLKNKGVTP